MKQEQSLLFDETGRLRSGWRATAFLFAFVLSAFVLVSLARIILSAFTIDAAPSTAAFILVNSSISFLLALLLGFLFGRYFEDLPFRALGLSFTSTWLSHLAAGLLAGAMTLTVAVLAAVTLGGLRFDNNPAEGAMIIRSLISSFVIFAVAAAFEEALFRGYILQTFARSGLAWLAILLSSTFFGAVHLSNPNVTHIGALNTVIAGLWFSIAYLKTRDLWFVIGMHFIWNWMQGSIFGIEVSGVTDVTSVPILREIDSGPVWVTGESYGIEGSIICTAVLVASTVLIYYTPWIRPDAEMLGLSTHGKKQDTRT